MDVYEDRFQSVEKEELTRPANFTLNSSRSAKRFFNLLIRIAGAIEKRGLLASIEYTYVNKKAACEGVQQMSAKVSPGEPLKPKQEALISLLLAGVSIVAAAKSVGIAEKTAHAWLKLPHFKTAYRNGQHELFRDAMQSLHGKIEKAISTLDRHMDNENTPAGSQIYAAKIILDQALAVDKMSEMEELQDKVTTLEGLIQT